MERIRELLKDDADKLLKLKLISQEDYDNLLQRKNEIVDDKTVDNLTKLASLKFPDKDLFSEVASILSKSNVKPNPEAIENNENLMKLALSSQAHFNSDDDVKDMVKGIEDKFAPITMDKDQYKKGLSDALNKKDEPLKEKNKKLTYLALASEPEEFKDVLDANNRKKRTANTGDA